MNSFPMRDLLSQAPADNRDEYLELFALWERLDAQRLEMMNTNSHLTTPMDADLDKEIIRKLTVHERRLYDLPQQDHLFDADGFRTGDLSPRWKNLTTILMARKGQRIESQWARIK